MKSLYSLSNIRGGLGSSGLPWYLSSSYKMDNVLPSVIMDFANNRYAVNGVKKSLSDFTFTRASNATYYGSDGTIQTAGNNTPRLHYDNGVNDGILIETSNTNQLLYSATLNTSGGWGGVGATLANNQGLSPDNTTQWSILTEDMAGTQHYVGFASLSVTSGMPYSFSVICKADTATVFQLTGSAAGFGTAIYANFNLSNGTVSVLGGGALRAKIEPLVNGIYRCSVSGVAIATTSVTFIGALCNNDPNAARVSAYTGTGKRIFLWGAQFEQSGITSSFIYTTTTAVTRASDSLIIPSSIVSTEVSQTASSFFFNFIKNHTFETSNRLLSGDNGYPQIFANGANMTMNENATSTTSVAIPASDISNKLSFGMNATNIIGAINGTLSPQVAGGSMPTITTLKIGGHASIANNELNGTIKEFRYYNFRGTNSELQRITQ